MRERAEVPLIIPSPLWGGAGVGVPAEGRRAAKPRTPHPALQATFSHKGRRDWGALTGVNL